MKRLLRFLAVFLMCLFALPLAADAAKWSFYFYLCGSDLETEGGAATEDLKEILAAAPSKDVDIIIQTGGAKKWRNDTVNPKKIMRWKCENGRLTKLQELPSASMGDSGTLASFLEFCRDRFSSERRIFVFWDHGGGSVYGLANDENYGSDGLSLQEVRSAFEKAFGKAPKEKPFEIIGFDTCLMSSFDTANTVKPFAKCMVGSQELEPGNGWEYTGWLNALVRKTSMSAPELGRVICDTYMKGCRAVDTDDAATLSVIDLGMMDRLTMAWNLLGLDAIVHASEDDSFYAKMGRAASRSENFMNSKSSGYSCMMDMGDFVRKMEKHFSSSSYVRDFLDILGRTVLYKVSGKLHRPSGLSCYHPYDSSRKSFRKMMDNGTVTSFLLAYGLQNGYLSEQEADRHFNRIVDSLPDDMDGVPGQPSAGHTQAHAPSPSTPQNGQLPGGLSSIAASVSGYAAQQGAPQQGGAASSVAAALSGITPPVGNGQQAPAAQQGGLSAAAGSVAAALNGASGSGAGQGGISSIAALAGTGAATLGDVLSQMSAAGEHGGIESLAALIASHSQVLTQAIAPMGRLDISSLEDHPVEIVRKDGVPGVEMHLDPAKVKYLESVGFDLAYFSEEKDIIIFLGSDVNMDRDWEKGVFRDNFNGSWAAIDGHPVFLEVTADVEDFNYYAVPVRLNGKRYNLEVSYDFKEQRYYVIGARRAMENGTVDKNLIKLREGDRIAPVLKKLTISGDDQDPVDFEGDEFVLGRNWKFEDADLRDGDYVYMFSMTDIQGNEATSDMARITLKKGDISYEKM